ERQAEHITGEVRQMSKEGSGRTVGGDLLGSIGKQHPQRGSATHDPSQQTEARRIGPLQIVDEQDGPPGGERLQQSYSSLQGQGSTTLGVDGWASDWP